jgi:hypothetical protein
MELTSFEAIRFFVALRHRVKLRDAPQEVL